MSGIFGVLARRGGRVDEVEFARMTASLQGLGRDGTTSTGDGVFRFGHCLMDRGPAARRPCGALHLEGPDVFLTGDLRLDNRSELGAALGMSTPAAEARSDSELVARAYERWGEDCPSRLLGDFAFALWDRRRRRLLLARDHFGIRPLFYAAEGDSFLFASALRGLLVRADISPALDTFMVARYLICACDAGGATLYSSIRSLPPGHTLVIEGDGPPRALKYWQPDPEARIRFRDERDYVEGFREHLVRAVHARVDAPARVGVMVSGGLDSATVTAIASSRRQGSSLVGLGHVVEPESPAAGLDERRYLEVLKGHLPQLDLRFVTAAGVSPLDGAEEVHRCLRLPIQTGLNYVHRSLFAAAGQAGCSVLLSGIGGDEVVSVDGDGHLAELLRSFALPRFALELSGESDRSGTPKLGLLLRALAAQLPRPVWHALHSLRQGYFGVFRTCLREDLARSLDLRSVLNARGGWWDLTGYVPPRLRDGLQLTVRLLSDEGFDSQNLVTQAADHDLSLRFPLADVRLIEFCLAIPTDQLSRAGEGRRLMRRAAEGLLPGLIRHRRDKRCFGPDYLLRVQESLPRIRRAVARFRTSETFRRFIDLESLDLSMERVSRAGLESPGVAWDCLGALLPACYLGLFLEIETRQGESPDARSRQRCGSGQETTENP